MQLINKLKKYICIHWYKNDVYSNPLYYQNNKILKVFKRCPFKIHIGKYHYIMFSDPIRNRPIEILFTGLGWKDKYNSPRYEYPPNILFKFFNIEFRIIWTWGDYLKDTIYWEDILSYYEYNIPLKNIGSSWIKDGKEINSRTLNMLKI